MRDTVCFYMGKAGSSTVVNACKSLDIHCSRAFDELEPAQKDYEYVVSLVREPVGRNVSAFFNDIANELADKKPSVEELTERFIDGWPFGNHMRPLIWFQACFDRELGYNVFDDKFSNRKGWQIVEPEGKRVLVIRTDVLTKKLGKGLSELYPLGEEEWPVVTHRGLGSEKYAHGVGDLYDEFLNTVELPTEYVDKMQDSEYAAHFFSKAHLKRLRERWTGVES